MTLPYNVRDQKIFDNIVYWYIKALAALIFHFADISTKSIKQFRVAFVPFKSALNILAWNVDVFVFFFF